MYWYHPAAYWDYMNFSEWVNLEILRRFNEEESNSPFHQTIHLAKEGSGEAADP